MRSFVPAAIAAAALLVAGPPAGAQNTELAPQASPPPAPQRSQPEPPAPKPAPASPTAAPSKAPQRPAAVPAATAATPAPTAAAPAAAAVPGARLQAGQTIPPAELAAFVDGVVHEAMRQQHVVGVTVAVVQNGQVLLKKGYGFASLAPARPVDPDRTLFRLGSASKLFTWVTLLQAAEAGRMRLDQPVNLYLPKPAQVRDQGFDQPVRVVDLMAHAGGFEDRVFGHLVESDPDYVRPLDLYLHEERPRRVRAPGEVASYSNYGAALAGAAAANAFGETFERVTEDKIFLPLGMNHTSFREKRPVKAALPAPLPLQLADNTADGFHWARGGFERRPYEYLGQIAPAASASSTAGDMARFMLALLGGGQFGGATIYGPGSAKALRTPILASPPQINGWAHGLMVEPLPGGRTGYGQLGVTTAFAAHLATTPDLNLGVFVAANTDSGGRLVQDLPGAVVREFYLAPNGEPRAGSPELVRNAALFTGRYLSTRRAYSGLEGFVDAVLGTARVRVTPDGRLVTEDASGAKVWVPEGELAEGRFIGLQDDERLVFRIGEGRALAYQTSPNVALFERISFWRSPDALALFGALTAAAALLGLVAAAFRDRRELRESAIQSRAGLIQNLQAALWLVALTCFSAWAANALADPVRLVFGWPDALLVTASACALVAACLTVTTMVALPAVWRGGRRVDSWPVGRRAAFTLTVAIYATFSVLLFMSSALAPWSG
jgi:CubicO group peptidase (beta-lactamase class C family)